MAADHLAGLEPAAIPPIRFTHHGHELEIGLFPSPAGKGYELLITDKGGVLLVHGLDKWLPWLPSDALKRMTKKAEGLLVQQRDALRNYVAGMDEETFSQLLATPRHRPEFIWTPERLRAAQQVDWENPDTKFTHVRHEFSIGHCTIPGGVLVVLRDRAGIFDASVSLNAAEIAAEAMQGRDMIERGIAGMREMVTALKAGEVRRMVAKPRVSMQPEALH